MIARLRADESLQVLIFVCGPLLLLLSSVIVLLIRGSRTIARYPTFSVQVERVSREDAYVIYRDQVRRVEFYMWPSGRRRAMLKATSEPSVADIRSIEPNLALGLAKLGFHQYSISKKGESQYVATGTLRGGYRTDGLEAVPAPTPAIGFLRTLERISRKSK